MPVQVRPAVPEAASGDNRPFWAIFLCKENSPQRRYAEALRLPGKLFPFCGLYHSPFFPFSPAFSRNAKLAQNPPSAPMSIAGVVSAASTSEAKAPTIAPIRAEAAKIDAIAITTMSAVQIFCMIKSLPKRNASLATKGYSRP